MKYFICFMLFVFSTSVFAATVEDVQILAVKSGPNNVELKLQARTERGTSYFYVDILRSDVNSFEKLNHVINKLTKKSSYRLDLDIISFSQFPSGSSYNSDSVRFFGTVEREPNSAKTPAQTKSKK